ncbi:MAG: conjugative transfer signal peptidase TraF [Rhodospirillales bacterium]|nr:conjugative transfer signal peptidase TraF [Rhodospirillales bacterium]
MNRSRKTAAVVVALAAFGGVATVAVERAGWRWNSTESAPVGLWQVVPRAPTVGAWVSFCPPTDQTFQGFKARGYIHGGPCPGDLQRLLKPVVARAGDVVTVAEDGVTVNGALLPDTEPHTQDSRGRPLVPRVVVQVVVEPGDLWVVSNHSPLSVDSRYFGPIRAASVEGAVVPVWVGR